MHLDLNIAKRHTPDLLNHITIALSFVGLYLTISQPLFFTGKSTLFQINTLPIFSILVFINYLLHLSLNKPIKYIPKSKLIQALLLYLSTTTIFSIFKAPEQTLFLFSLIILVFNLQSSQTNQLKKTIFFSTLTVSIIAITQFILQSDLGLQFLGEPRISNEIKGIAKLSNNIIRPYGLFQHPNILAGILVITSFINPYTNIPKSYSTQIIGLLSTFSLNGLLAFTSKHVKTIKTFILVSIIGIISFTLIKSPQFLLERIQQIIEILYSPNQAKPWEIQPIHNSFLLSIIKYGPIHLLAFSYLIFNLYKTHKQFTLAFIILLSFDHYFLTSFQAISLLVITIFTLSAEAPIQTDLEKQTKTQQP